MANHATTGITPTEAYLGKTLTRLSWGSIFAGVVIAISVQLVLGILGAGIGLTLVRNRRGGSWAVDLRGRCHVAGL
jgi:hypothetical protein